MMQIKCKKKYTHRITVVFSIQAYWNSKKKNIIKKIEVAKKNRKFRWDFQSIKGILMEWKDHNNDNENDKCNTGEKFNII